MHSVKEYKRYQVVEAIFVPYWVGVESTVMFDGYSVATGMAIAAVPRIVKFKSVSVKIGIR